MSERFHLVVSLWIHPGQAEAFEAYERDAARTMVPHGGRIDHAMRLASPGSGAGEGADAPTPYEVHFVSFPSDSAFHAYRLNPEADALSARSPAIFARVEVRRAWPAGPYP